MNEIRFITRSFQLIFISSLLSCASSAQDCKEGINLLPMYGNSPKCDEQIRSDNEFLALSDAKVKDRKKAALTYIDLAWGYYYKNDLETAMKRFNQAWLLDSLNADVYWGYGNLLGRKHELKASISHFKKSLKLNANNPRVYESIANSYGQLFSETSDKQILDKAIENLKAANRLDKSNPRILAQLSAAYSYYSQKDSANKYLRLADQLDPKAVNPEVRALLNQK